MKMMRRCHTFIQWNHLKMMKELIFSIKQLVIEVNEALINIKIKTHSDFFPPWFSFQVPAPTKPAVPIKPRLLAPLPHPHPSCSPNTKPPRHRGVAPAAGPNRYDWFPVSQWDCQTLCKVTSIVSVCRRPPVPPIRPINPQKVDSSPL